MGIFFIVTSFCCITLLLVFKTWNLSDVSVQLPFWSTLQNVTKSKQEQHVKNQNGAWIDTWLEVNSGGQVRALDLRESSIRN